MVIMCVNIYLVFFLLVFIPRNTPGFNYHQIPSVPIIYRTKTPRLVLESGLQLVESLLMT